MLNVGVPAFSYFAKISDGEDRLDARPYERIP